MFDNKEPKKKEERGERGKRTEDGKGKTADGSSNTTFARAAETFES